TLNRNAARLVLRARDQLVRELRHSAGHQSGRISANRIANADEVVLRSLLMAFPDRLARRREPRSPRGVMVGGRGVRLAPSSAVVEPELFLCIDVDAGQAETLVRQASVVERDWLPAEQLRTSVDVWFDLTAERVVAR